MVKPVKHKRLYDEDVVKHALREAGCPGENQKSDNPESLWINVSFLDIKHTVEIVKVKYVVQNSDVARYTVVTDCAFMNLDGKSVLAIELRKTRHANSNIKVVVAESRLGGREVTLGFIVNSVEEFYKKLY